jgi:uncharacterized protein (DUF2249 family)/hemerythrin-like domain-containing protein
MEAAIMTMSLKTKLICHELPPAERKAAVLAAFDALAASESLVLESDHRPSPVLTLLQELRPGRFEWSPLIEGPPLWRAEITKRAADRRHREVTEALSWDHDRLEELEAAAFAARGRGEYAEAASLFSQFAFGLRRHIGFEDGLLFPEFEQRSGISPNEGPTAVLRAEHRRIEGFLSEIEQRMGDPAADLSELRADLERVLSDHNVKEEMVLYPGTDRLMSDGERDELVRHIQEYNRPG